MTDLFDLDLVEDLKADVTALPIGWPADGLKPHPFAALNRMMTPEEFQGLKASIGASGQREKIVMFEDKILDGRNRYLAGIPLGRFAANVDWRTHPDFIEFGGKGWDPDRGTEALSFVWDMEVRRHRSARDTALAAARYLRFIAELKPEFPEGKTAKLRLPSQADMAKRYGISERLINSAVVLLERAEPEVIAAVEGGKLSLSDAADVVTKLDKVEQRIIAENPDRKTVKRAVKAAKPKVSRQAALDLPAPISRTVLAVFAKVVLKEAAKVAEKHGKPGASMSADAVLTAARKNGLIETSGNGFTPAMLLALGELRDMPETKPEKPRAEPPQGPSKQVKLDEAYAAEVVLAKFRFGKHTQKTAEPIVRAAEAAGIKLSIVAADIGHSRETIGGWRRRLGLQKTGRRAFEPVGATA